MIMIVTADILALSLERNSVLSELTFQHFEYDFQTMTLKSQKNPAKINGYSAVLQFVLPRFISSKKFRTYITIDGKTLLRYYFLEVSVPNELSVNTN